MSLDHPTQNATPGQNRRRQSRSITSVMVSVQLRDPQDHQLMDPQGWSQIQQRVTEIADALLPGHVVQRNTDCVGDSLQLRFTDVNKALRWSIALQAHLLRSEMPEPWGKAQCAIGIEIGPHPVGDRWDTPGADIAFALCRAAATGGILAGHDAWSAALRMLPGGLLHSEDLGPCRFPGIEGATRAWALYAVDAPAPQGPIQIVPPNTNLTAEPPEFFGRNEEIEDIDLLFRSGAAVVWLVGPGGIGKSRLSQRYAALHLHEYAAEGGAWIVYLNQTKTARAMIALLAEVLDVSLVVLPNAEDQLCRALDERGRMLIILDAPSSELLDLPDLLKRWSKKAPRARFLVNSNNRRDGIHEYEVGPFDTDSAAQFFARCASRTRSDFSLENEEEGVLQVVERVDRMPLAIELAAAWVDLLSPEQLLERLVEDLDVLSQNPSKPDHTLSAVMETTWKQLDRWQQLAMEQISAFRGGFTLEALDAVLTFPVHYETPTTVQILTGLRRKSLIQLYEPEGQPGLLRFRTNALIQDFAMQRLRRSGRHAAAYRRHTDWALTLGSKLSDGAARGDRHSLAALAVERKNLTVLCDRLRAHGGTSMVRALLTLQPLYAIRGPWVTWQSLAEEAVSHSIRAPLQVRVLSHQALAEALLARGRPEQALVTLDQSVEELQRLGRRIPKLEAPLHNQIGQARLALGDPESALDSADYAQAMAVDPWHKGVSNSVAARAFAALGNLEQAKKKQAEAAEQLRKCGAYRDEALARQHLGDLLRTSGAPEDAQELYDHALEIHEAQGDRPLLALLQHRLGTLNLDLNNLDRARTHFADATQCFAEIGDARSEAIVRGNLARLEQLSNKPREALTAFRRAHHSLGELGDRRFHAIHLANEGLLLHEIERIPDARKALGEALTEIQEVGDQRFIRLIALRLGALESDQGNLQAARDAFTIAEAVNAPLDSVGEAAERVYRAHLLLAENRGNAKQHNAARREATRLWHEVSGTSQVPGIAARSADVRLATRLLARALRRAAG